MQRANSLEMTLMLGKIEGRKEREKEREREGTRKKRKEGK